jgi:hypothetical protein
MWWATARHLSQSRQLDRNLDISDRRITSRTDFVGEVFPFAASLSRSAAL